MGRIAYVWAFLGSGWTVKLFLLDSAGESPPTSPENFLILENISFLFEWTKTDGAMCWSHFIYIYILLKHCVKGNEPRYLIILFVPPEKDFTNWTNWRPQNKTEMNKVSIPYLHALLSSRTYKKY